MKSYIDNCELNVEEVKSALYEQVNEPYKRTPETEKSEFFNSANTGGCIFVARTTKEMEVDFAFPMEDIGTQ